VVLRAAGRRSGLETDFVKVVLSSRLGLETYRRNHPGRTHGAETVAAFLSRIRYRLGESGCHRLRTDGPRACGADRVAQIVVKTRKYARMACQSPVWSGHHSRTTVQFHSYGRVVVRSRPEMGHEPSEVRL
jgi:hypothetical protein